MFAQDGNGNRLEIEAVLNTQPVDQGLLSLKNRLANIPELKVVTDTSQVKALEDTLKNVSKLGLVQVTVDTVGLGALNILAQTISQIENRVYSVSAAINRAFSDLANSATEAYKRFEQGRNALATLTRDADSLALSIKGLTRQLNFQVSSADLLAAGYDVLSAGFTEATEAQKVLEASARGAVGGFSDVKTVADALTSTLNAYGETADMAAKRVDQFIQIQNLGKLTVNDLANSLGNVISTAAMAGVSFEEVGAFISLATAKGVGASEAIVGLNQALKAILKPSSEAQRLAEELGVAFDEQALKAKGLAGILEELQAKGAATATNLNVLFGSTEALRTILPAVGDGAATLAQNMELIRNASGASVEAFQKVDRGLGAELKRLTGQIQEFLTELGRGAADVLTPLVQALSRLIELVNSIPTPIKRVVGGLAVFIGVFGKIAIFSALVASRLAIFRAAVNLFQGVLQKLGVSADLSTMKVQSFLLALTNSPGIINTVTSACYALSLAQNNLGKAILDTTKALVTQSVQMAQNSDMAKRVHESLKTMKGPVVGSPGGVQGSAVGQDQATPGGPGVPRSERDKLMRGTLELKNREAAKTQQELNLAQRAGISVNRELARSKEDLRQKSERLRQSKERLNQAMSPVQEGARRVASVLKGLGVQILKLAAEFGVFYAAFETASAIMRVFEDGAVNLRKTLDDVQRGLKFDRNQLNLDLDKQINADWLDPIRRGLNLTTLAEKRLNDLKIAIADTGDLIGVLGDKVKELRTNQVGAEQFQRLREIIAQVGASGQIAGEQLQQIRAQLSSLPNVVPAEAIGSFATVLMEAAQAPTPEMLQKLNLELQRLQQSAQSGAVQSLVEQIDQLMASLEEAKKFQGISVVDRQAIEINLQALRNQKAALQEMTKTAQNALEQQTRLAEEAQDTAKILEEAFKRSLENIKSVEQRTLAEIAEIQLYGGVSAEEAEKMRIEAKRDALEKQLALEKEYAKDSSKTREELAKAELELIEKEKQAFRESIEYQKKVIESFYSERISRLDGLIKSLDIGQQQLDNQIKALGEVLRGVELDKEFSKAAGDQDRYNKLVEREWEIKKQIFDLEIKREQIAARRAEIEARKTLLQAEKELKKAAKDLEAARATGDRKAVQEAETAYKLAKDQISLAKEELKVAQENIGFQRRVAELRRQNFEREKRNALMSDEQLDKARDLDSQLKDQAFTWGIISNKMSGANEVMAGINQNMDSFVRSLGRGLDRANNLLGVLQKIGDQSEKLRSGNRLGDLPAARGGAGLRNLMPKGDLFGLPQIPGLSPPRGGREVPGKGGVYIGNINVNFNQAEKATIVGLSSFLRGAFG